MSPVVTEELVALPFVVRVQWHSVDQTVATVGKGAMSGWWLIATWHLYLRSAIIRTDAGKTASTVKGRTYMVDVAKTSRFTSPKAPLFATCTAVRFSLI